MDYSVFDFILDSVFVLNENKEIIYANEVGANLCDSTVKRLMGGRLSHEILSFDNNELFWMKKGSLGFESPSTYIETFFKNVKGRVGLAQVYIQPEPNEPNRWLVFVRDVSLEETLHRKYKLELESKDKAYLELKDAQEQLIQVGKMATLGQFVATVSHELNNPLAIVHASAEELKEALTQQKPDLEIGTALANFILDASGKMIKILKNMRILTHSQGEKFNFEKANISELMGNTVRYLRGIAEKSHVVILNRCPKDLPIVMADPGLIDQLAVNLMKNSLDALESNQTKNPEIIVDGYIESLQKQVVVSFQDNGPGVSPEYREKVFKPFFTTKGMGKGTGLGLMICQKIALQHGGRMELDANYKNGARFLLYLPIMPV